MTKKKWIQKAKLKKGAFTKQCKENGFKGVTNACIEKELKSKNSTTRKRASLAKTFRHMKKKKK